METGEQGWGQTGAKAQRCGHLRAILGLGQKQDGPQAWRVFFFKPPGDSTVQPRGRTTGEGVHRAEKARQRGAVIPHFAVGETETKRSGHLPRVSPQVANQEPEPPLRPHHKEEGHRPAL